MSPALLFATVVALLVGIGAGALIPTLIRRNRATPPVDDTAAAEVSADAIRANLAELARRIDVLNAGQATAASQLSEQLRTVADGNSEVLRTTHRLTEALHNPGPRGRWGEVQLQRIVEVAGLVRGVDFVDQQTIVSADQTIRPDLVITLPDDRTIVVDAKVPLDALLNEARYADSGNSDSGNLDSGNLDSGNSDSYYSAASAAAHAASLSAHIDQLASKTYWRQFSRSPEFVVLFLPAESLLSHALRANPGLLERAFSKNVALATPTTLLALLRTVALGWRDRDVAENAAAIHQLGVELHDRLRVMNTHIARLGQDLGNAVGSYNKLVGSYESRVLVSARRMNDLGLAQAGIPQPTTVDPLIRDTSGVALAASEGR